MNFRVLRLECLKPWAVAIAFTLFAGPAVAVERIRSDCTPKVVEENNACTTIPHDYSLGPLATTEFRGYCDADPPNKYVLDPQLTVDSKDSGVSCTIDLFVSPYASLSCTNWSLTRHKSVSLRLECVLRLESSLGPTPCQ